MLSGVPIYDVYARFAILKDAESRQIDEAELERQLSAVQERLSDYKGRAFGRSDDFIVGVEIEAESAEAARKQWFSEVDHAIDKAGLTEDVPIVVELRAVHPTAPTRPSSFLLPPPGDDRALA